MRFDDMPAGREMDALVAEKVMGAVPCDAWKNFHADEMMNDLNCGHELGMCYPREQGPPMYSKLISAAWEVVEKLTENNNGYFELHKDFGGWFTASFAITLSKDDERRKLGYGNWKYESEGNDTAPLAICRAALKAQE